MKSGFLSILACFFLFSPAIADDQSIERRYCYVDVFVNCDHGNRQEFAAIHVSNQFDQKPWNASAIIADQSFEAFFEVEKSANAPKITSSQVGLKSTKYEYDGGQIRVGTLRIIVSDILVVRKIVIDDSLKSEIDNKQFTPWSMNGLKRVTWDEFASKYGLKRNENARR